MAEDDDRHHGQGRHRERHGRTSSGAFQKLLAGAAIPTSGALAYEALSTDPPHHDHAPSQLIPNVPAQDEPEITLRVQNPDDLREPRTW